VVIPTPNTILLLKKRSKTLIQSMDEFIEPVKKLVEYRNLLNQLSVLDQQQQAPRQFSIQRSYQNVWAARNNATIADIRQKSIS
jgi:hypothetical protein